MPIIRDDLSDFDKFLHFNWDDIVVSVVSLASVTMLVGLLLNWVSWKQTCRKIKSGEVRGLCFGFYPLPTIFSLILANGYIWGFWWLDQVFAMQFIMPPLILLLYMMCYMAAVIEVIIACNALSYCTAILLSEGMLKIYRPVTPPEKITLKQIHSISLQQNKRGRAKRLNLEFAPQDGTIDILQLPGLKWIFGSFVLTRISIKNKPTAQDKLVELHRMLTAARS